MEVRATSRYAGVAPRKVRLVLQHLPGRKVEEALNLLRDGAIDIVTFTSSSTVRNLAALLDGDLSALSATSPLSRASGEGPGVRVPLIACIGPITAATARELGLSVDLVAEKYTVEGLVKALVARLTQVVVVST